MDKEYAENLKERITIAKNKLNELLGERSSLELLETLVLSKEIDNLIIEYYDIFR